MIRGKCAVYFLHTAYRPIAARICSAAVTDSIHSKLLSLDLSGYIGVKGLCCAFQTLLPNLPFLEKLSVVGAGMYYGDASQHLAGDGGVDGNTCVGVLADEAAVHTSLRCLDLRDNGIATVGAKRLLHMIEANARITSLDLGGNHIKGREQRLIADRLCINVNTTDAPQAHPTRHRPDTDDTPCVLPPGLPLDLHTLLEGAVYPVTSVSAGTVQDAFHIVVRGSVGVGVVQPARGGASGTVATCATVCAPALLPYTALLAEDVPAGGETVGGAWDGVCADDTFLRTFVRTWRGVSLSAVAGADAQILRVRASHTQRVARALRSRLLSTLPTVARVPWLQGLPWSRLLSLCDCSTVATYAAGERVARPAHHVHVIASGTVQVCAGVEGQDKHEEPSVARIYSVLDVLGLEACLTGDEEEGEEMHCATAAAVVQIPAADLLSAVDEYSTRDVLKRAV